MERHIEEFVVISMATEYHMIGIVFIVRISKVWRYH